MLLKNITIQLADWSDYLVIIVALFSFWSTPNNSYFKLLSSYLLVLSGFTLATIVTAQYRIHNAYVYHAIGCIELIFIFLLYIKIGLQKSWYWVFLVTLTAYITNSIYEIVNGSEEINSVGQSFSMLFIMVLGFNFLLRLYQEEKVERLGSYPYFYINAGFTLFSAGSFFGYLLIARFTKKEIPDENFYYSWLIISGFTYIKFILISIGIFISKKYAK